MTRRELLIAGTAVLAARAASAAIYDWGRMYELPGSSGPRIAVLGEPPAAPRPTVLLCRSAAQSLTGLGLSLSTAPLALLMQTAGWTVCAVDLPCEAGCDRWPGEPHQIPGLAHRLANGRSLWTPAPGQAGFRQRAYSGLNLLAAEGYADLDNLWAAGLSRGALFAAHYAVYDTRIRGLALFHPLTELLALTEFAGHPFPELCAAENVALLAPQLAGRPVYLSVNTWDTRVNTEAAIAAARAFTAAGGPTDTAVPDVTLRVPTVPGHASPDSAYTEARDWLMARV